jgi:hypothetical protein
MIRGNHCKQPDWSMFLIALLAAGAMFVPIALFDQYLLARSERFVRQHRSEMSRLRDLLN